MTLVALLLVGGSAGSAAAYSVRDNWCDKDLLRWGFIDQSFIDRNIDPPTFWHDALVAASWWSEVNASLQPGVRVNPNCDGEFNDCEPSLIAARCQGEDPAFASGRTYAYTHTNLGYHPSCDFFGLNMDEWYMVFRTDRPGSLGCGDNSYWAYTVGNHSDGTGRLALYRGLAHEFGHVMGLSHTQPTNPNAIMFETTDWNNYINSDDITGVITGLHENRRLSTLRTTIADTSGATIIFGAPRVAPNTSNVFKSPSAFGNQAHPLGWDFAVTWTDQNDHIWIGTAKENDSDPEELIWVTKKDLDVGSPSTAFRSRHKVGIGVTETGIIGLAWSRADNEAIEFAYSQNSGASWVLTTVGGGHHPLGGVSVAYAAPSQRWVLAWVANRGDLASTRILTLISPNATPPSWNANLVQDNGDAFSMPIRQPALACDRSNDSLCQMAMMSYLWSDKPLMTAGLALTVKSGTDLYLNPLADPHDLEGITYAWADLGITTLPDGRYMLSYTDNTVEGGPMSYAFLAAAEDETGVFRNRQTWPGGPTSRSGFATAYNYRRHNLRIVWVP